MYACGCVGCSCVCENIATLNYSLYIYMCMCVRILQPLTTMYMSVNTTVLKYTMYMYVCVCVCTGKLKI